MSQPLLQPLPGAGALGDSEVVARVVAGDAALFEILMRRHNQRLYRVARGILGEHAEAEDAMQETYVRAFRELASFRGEAAFSTWLTRIAVHESLARVRKRRHLVAVDHHHLPERPDHSAAANPESAAGNRELRAAIHQAVEQLPDALRAVFVLREVEELSTEEVAKSLGISRENVRVRLHRANALLRQRLDEHIGREVRRLYMFAGADCDRVVAAVLKRLARS